MAISTIRRRSRSKMLRITLGEGQLHLQRRKIEQARLDVVGLAFAG